jgi:hypothetical protein
MKKMVELLSYQVELLSHAVFGCLTLFGLVDITSKVTGGRALFLAPEAVLSGVNFTGPKDHRSTITLPSH